MPNLVGDFQSIDLLDYCRASKKTPRWSRKSPLRSFGPPRDQESKTRRCERGFEPANNSTKTKSFVPKRTTKKKRKILQDHETKPKQIQMKSPETFDPASLDSPPGQGPPIYRWPSLANGCESSTPLCVSSKSLHLQVNSDAEALKHFVTFFWGVVYLIGASTFFLEFSCVAQNFWETKMEWFSRWFNQGGSRSLCFWLVVLGTQYGLLLKKFPFRSTEICVAKLPTYRCKTLFWCL